MKTLAGALIQNLFLLLFIISIAWALEIIDFFSGPMVNLDRMGGIQPLDPYHLHGIITAHWLHGGFKHLLGNTGPFFLLGGFVLIGGRTLFWKVSAFVTLTGGSLLWLLGGIGNNHLGASLLIFGYLGFLLSRGIFEKSALWVTVSIVTLLLYGGMIFGVLPGQPEVSWQGHLFGFISGIVAARVLIPKNKSIYLSQADDSLLPAPDITGNRSTRYRGPVNRMR